MTDLPHSPVPPKPELSEAQRSAFDTLFGSLPDDLLPRVRMLEELSRTFRKKIAQELEPSLNQHVKNRSAESLADRRVTASWVNSHLNDFGLCVTVEGKPALFVAELEDSRRPASHCYAVLVPKGDRFTRVVSSRDAPYLTLDAAPQGINEILRNVRRVVYQGRNY